MLRNKNLSWDLHPFFLNCGPFYIVCAAICYNVVVVLFHKMLFILTAVIYFSYSFLSEIVVCSIFSEALFYYWNISIKNSFSLQNSIEVNGNFQRSVSLAGRMEF